MAKAKVTKKEKGGISGKPHIMRRDKKVILRYLISEIIMETYTDKSVDSKQHDEIINLTKRIGHILNLY